MKGPWELAFDGLRRKPGRNLLTLGGVAIGVLALTLIVALGQGLSGLVRTTVAGEDNLRQIGLSPGFGTRIRDPDEIRVDEQVEAERRERLRRALRTRSRPGSRIGRRAQAMDEGSLEELRALPHVERVDPIVLERYRLRCSDHEVEAGVTLGIDVDRRRVAERVVAGRYFSSPIAEEALVHEVLAYRWGYVRASDLEGLVGRQLTLRAIQGGRATGLSSGLLAQVLERIETLPLEEEERAVGRRLAERLLAGETDGASTIPVERNLTVVGIVRDLEPGDAFRVIEDGNALQADVFLPQQLARELYLSAPVNQELGFQRAVVTADSAANAREVETSLRDLGYTAFSVATVVQRVEDLLAGLTIAVSLLTGIALFVAALGIVNTMVTSVLERTREIGLWKAVGATRGQVRKVFLLEAAGLGLLGGLLGLGLALVLMVPLEGVARDMIAERASVPVRGHVFSLPAWLPVAGPLLATVVAMAASWLPAHRAATIDPVRALRSE